MREHRLKWYQYIQRWPRDLIVRIVELMRVEGVKVVEELKEY